MKTLVLNSGSSTQKSAIFELGPESSDEPVTPLWEGKLEWDGDKESLTIQNSNGKTVKEEAVVQADNRRASLEKLLKKLRQSPTQVIRDFSEIQVVGHRIVHGGPKLSEPAIITSEVKEAISKV